MTKRFTNLVLALLFAALVSKPAYTIWQKGQVSQHDHSSPSQGGFLGVTQAAALTLTGMLQFATSSSPSLINVYPNVVSALSADGVTQSSGCFVTVYYPTGGAPSASAVFTSTTSAGTIGFNLIPGVLIDNNCVPGTRCNVALGPSIVRVQADATGIASGDAVNFSGTRCRVAQDVALNNNYMATVMDAGAVGANAFTWIRLTAR